MKKIAEERKREKMEEKLARQRVLDQIARDKEARAQKLLNQGQPPESSPAPVAQAAATPAPTSVVDKKQYDKTRLQVFCATIPRRKKRRYINEFWLCFSCVFRPVVC
jgi:hypothetical protein